MSGVYGVKLWLSELTRKKLLQCRRMGMRMGVGGRSEEKMHCSLDGRADVVDYGQVSVGW